MKNKKIAVIDEDKAFLKELQGILSMSGYEPVVVNDTYLAVKMIAQFEPDVIILGLKMPRKNGFELAREINRVFEVKKIPIIAMSEIFKDEFKFLLDLCGIDKFLKKPFFPLNIIWAIENVTLESNQSNADYEISNEVLKVISYKDST